MGVIRGELEATGEDVCNEAEWNGIGWFRKIDDCGRMDEYFELTFELEGHEAV